VTVSNTASKVIALGNGATTVFNYGFLINLAADALVVFTSAAGVETVLGPSLYSITGLGNAAGGTVTYPLAGSPIAAGTRLTIARNAPDTQLTDLVSQGSFSPDVVETGLDDIVLQVQQLAEMASRSVMGPISDVSAFQELPAASVRALGILGFDGSGQPIITANAGGQGPTGPAGTDNGNPNMIVNPDCAVAQLGTTILAVADNAYTSDGLRVLSEANGDVDWSQDSNGFFAGLVFTDKLSVAVANKKFGFFKPIEFKDIGKLGVTGNSIIGMVKLARSGVSLQNFKMAVLAFTGTADAISGDPISAWNGDGVTPTLAANWFYCNAPVGFTITTGMVQYSAVGIVPAGTKNIVLFVWNDDKVTTGGDAVFAGDYDVRQGNVVLPFAPVNFQQNLARCQRYAPVFDAALVGAEPVAVGFISTAGSVERLVYRHPVRTRIPTTGIIVSNATNFIIENLAASTAVTSIGFSSGGQDGTILQVATAALVAGQACLLRGGNVNCRIEFTGARL
jgi:hypothetical protein